MQKILVVEDDQELNQALCYALEKEGYAPVPVFSIEEAKLQFQKLAEKHGDFNAVSLMIQDVNLPDGEGFELCRWIKEHLFLMLFSDTLDFPGDPSDPVNDTVDIMWILLSYFGCTGMHCT